MRILWVSPHCWPDYVLRSPGLGIKSQGGQSVVMYHCPRALTELDEDTYIDVYARLETGEPEVVQLGERVRLIRLLCGDPDVYVPKEKFWYGPLQQFVNELDEYTKQHHLSYDLIHGHYADGWYVANHLSKIWNIPYCLTTHSLGKRKRANSLAMQEGDEATLDKKYSFSIRIKNEMVALQEADRICPLTQEEGQYIVENYSANEEKLHTIPNGILLSDFFPKDKEKITELRKQLGLKENDLVILQAGRVARRKGQKELITAAPRVIEEVKKRTGRNVKLLMIGWTESEFASSLEEKVRETKLTDDIIFLPPVNNLKMPPYFGLADVYALTSTYDILPIVILEAMASGLAIVASQNGGASEIISHGNDGLLVDPYNNEQIEDALISVLSDDELRSNLGEQAFLKAKTKYTWHKVAEQLDQLYREILKENER